MKKFLVLILLAAVALAGGAAALAVVPHCHEDDLDHSRHGDCAVHQAQGFLLGTAVVALTLFHAPLRESFEPTARAFFSPSFLSNPRDLRAPPFLY